MMYQNKKLSWNKIDVLEQKRCTLTKKMSRNK